MTVLQEKHRGPFDSGRLALIDKASAAKGVGTGVKIFKATRSSGSRRCPTAESRGGNQCRSRSANPATMKWG